jgi:lipoprotein-anchoring transpeptidase ErfK/SrfK
MRKARCAVVLVLSMCVACSGAVPLALETHLVSGVAVPQSSAAVERPMVQRPAAVPRAERDPVESHGMLIEISIRSQRLTAWDDGVVVMRAVISTGRPGYETPPGHYRVIFKNPMAWSSKWGVWMPWALNIHGNYFIHQLPHYPGSSVNIGASTLGSPASHGCVRVGIPDAERLFRWARVGTPVWIH